MTAPRGVLTAATEPLFHTPLGADLPRASRTPSPAVGIPPPNAGDAPAIEACGLDSREKDALAAGATTHTVALPDGYSPDNQRTLFQCGANARLHRMVRSRITKQIRGDVAAMARIQKSPKFTVPVTITAVQHPGKGKRALDSENVAPLVKAAIDGLRDAGVLVNDSPKYVRAVTFTVGDRSLHGQLILHISPADGGEY